MMTNVFGGIASIVTGGLDLVKMLEQTMDMLTSILICVVLLHPMEAIGLK